ncbi:hypothetical protein QCA50_005910 [Cerrena zonata]|uniref:Translation initiation factor IF-3 n=1 Tax=Cerrena zonata TaxID=2478898 RepID=A0AAW0GBT3_9APHY
MSLSLTLRCARLPKPSVCRSCRRTFQTRAPHRTEQSAPKAFDLGIGPNKETRDDKKRHKHAQVGQSNEQIPLRTVKLVDPETGKLHDPAPLAALLAVIDRGSFQLTLASVDPEPLVKLIRSDELYKQKKEEQKKKKAVLQALEEKEIQMTWGVDPHDFKTKIKHAHRELTKGHRVNLVFAPKKGQPWLNSDGMAVRVQEAVDQLADDGHEWKTRDVQHATTIVYLQGIKKEKKGKGE